MDESTADRLNRVVAEFEAQFTVHDEIGYPATVDKQSRSWSKCATGAAYQRIVGIGQADVIQAWLDEATTYALEAQGKHLWWRERPLFDGGSRTQIYSRFVITKEST